MAVSPELSVDLTELKTTMYGKSRDLFKELKNSCTDLLPAYSLSGLWSASQPFGELKRMVTPFSTGVPQPLEGVRVKSSASDSDTKRHTTKATGRPKRATRRIDLTRIVRNFVNHCE